MISGNTYILAFLRIVVVTIPGNFRKGGAHTSTKIRNCGRHFSGKNLHLISWISGNTYILAFLVILSTEIPGNSKKGWPQISTKTRNCGRHFSGKNLYFGSTISGNTYILTFLHIVSTTISWNFRKEGPRFSWKFEISEDPGKFEIFGILVILDIFSRFHETQICVKFITHRKKK